MSPGSLADSLHVTLQTAPKRLAVCVLALAFLSACQPRLIPIPVTQGPTEPPATPTPVAIDAPVVSSPGLVSIRMLDENNGWGISDTAVLRTVDGGVTWHNVSPVAVSSFGYSISSDFLDLLHGWVLVADPNNMLNGILYRTNDGGGKWTESPVPFGGGPLHFLDPRNGWIMASLGAGAGSMGVAIFQSSDGGATWIQTYSNDPNQAAAASSLPLGGLKNDITPVNMQTAWIGGVVYSPGVIYLYKTNDAGHSWAQSPITVPAGYEQAEVETPGPIVMDPNVAFLPVHLTSQNGVMLDVYLSRDGGASWAPSPTLIPQGGAVDFVSVQSGFVWNGTVFYFSNDAAQTWSLVAPDVAFGDAFSGMDFVSPQIGFVLTGDASGARALYKTTDGAHTWNMLSH